MGWKLNYNTSNLNGFMKERKISKGDKSIPCDRSIFEENNTKEMKSRESSEKSVLIMSNFNEKLKKKI